VICWFVYIGNWFVYIRKNPRFMAFLDSNLHTRLAIVTENELGLAFPARNLPKKFHPDPSTFYLVVVVTNEQTERQTNTGDYIKTQEKFLPSFLPCRRTQMYYNVSSHIAQLYPACVDMHLISQIDGFINGCG